MGLKPPDYDRKPVFTDGVGLQWVGYGMFDEWCSACFFIIAWKEELVGPEEENSE